MTDDGRIRWFGEPWGAQINVFADRIPTPIGEPCAYCGEPIATDHRGVSMIHVDSVAIEYRPWHLDCFLRSILPPPGHWPS